MRSSWLNLPHPWPRKSCTIHVNEIPVQRLNLKKTWYLTQWKFWPLHFMFNRLKDFQFLGDGQLVMFNTKEKRPRYLSHLSYVRCFKWSIKSSSPSFDKEEVFRDRTFRSSMSHCSNTGLSLYFTHLPTIFDILHRGKAIRKMVEISWAPRTINTPVDLEYNGH